MEWHLVRPPYPRDYQDAYNWRTDPAIATGGYFDDLASHGLDLIAYLLGDITQASGHSNNQQGRYRARDAVSASWLHASGATGSGYWNFGCFSDEDKVSIYGNAGKIEFSVFKNEPLALTNVTGRQEVFYRESGEYPALPCASHARSSARLVTAPIHRPYRHSYGLGGGQDTRQVVRTDNDRLAIFSY